jgi:N-acetylglutamate synthase/N-acetylornithine aminotransferase
MIEISVVNAMKHEDAEKIAATIATSPLVKTAFFGSDRTGAGYGGK